MRIDAFSSFYERNKIDETKLKEHLVFLLEIEKQITDQDPKLLLELISEEQLDFIISYLLGQNKNFVNNFIILMRYFKAVERNDLFIHLTRYTGSLGVMESILDKVQRIIGEEKAKIIREEIDLPKLGTPIKEMPIYTKNMLEVFDKYLSPDQIKKSLSDNHHQIPKEAFVSEKVLYEAALSLDDYLKDLHLRKVKELEEHLKENRVWFEQEINDEVINFVKSNQEILSAVRKGNQLFITKIPYDTKAYLSADNDEDKKYYLCHCPFIRSIFNEGELKVSPTWCNCSGGFTKFPFEVIFDQELDITCIETPLKGDDLCRFVISLDGVDYKR